MSIFDRIRFSRLNTLREDADSESWNELIDRYTDIYRKGGLKIALNVPDDATYQEIRTEIINIIQNEQWFKEEHHELYIGTLRRKLDFERLFFV